jgi:hypothetical protein
VAYRRNVCRLDRTAARMLIVPTTNRTRSALAPSVPIASGLVFCSDAKALVPTSVVNTTTGIPSKRYRRCIRSAIRRWPCSAAATLRCHES